MLHEENVLGVFQILWFQKKLVISLILFSLIFPLSLLSKPSAYFRNSIYVSLNPDFFESNETLFSQKHMNLSLATIVDDYNRVCNEEKDKLAEFESAFYSVIANGKLSLSLNEGNQGDKEKHPRLLNSSPMSVSKKLDGECFPLGDFRYPTYEINFKTSNIPTDVNFAKLAIRKANELASHEYLQIVKREFDHKKQFYNKQIELNLEAIEFYEENFPKETGTGHPQSIQETPIFDDIVKTDIAVHKYKIVIYKYNLEKLVLRNKHLKERFEQNRSLPLFKFKNISNIAMKQPSVSYSVVFVACLIMSLLVVFLLEYFRRHFSILNFPKNK